LHIAIDGILMEDYNSIRVSCAKAYGFAQMLLSKKPVSQEDDQR